MVKVSTPHYRMGKSYLRMADDHIIAGNQNLAQAYVNSAVGHAFAGEEYGLLLYVKEFYVKIMGFEKVLDERLQKIKIAKAELEYIV